MNKVIRALARNSLYLLAWIPDSAYLKIMYRAKMGKKLNLKDPQTFNEKLQWLKLHDRKPEYEESSGSMSAVLLVLVLAAAAGGGAYFYFKVYKPKQEADAYESENMEIGDGLETINEDEAEYDETGDGYDGGYDSGYDDGYNDVYDNGCGEE